MNTMVEVYNYKQIFKREDAKSVWDMECGESYRFVMEDSKFVDISNMPEKEQIRFRTLIGAYNTSVKELCYYTNTYNTSIFNKTVLKLKFDIKSNLSSAMSLKKKFDKIAENLDPVIFLNFHALSFLYCSDKTIRLSSILKSLFNCLINGIIIK